MKATATPRVYRTTDYSLFRLNPANRPVSESHVRRIERSMEERGNLMHLYPIVCSAEGEITDGQHRFTAAKRRGEAVFYVLSDEVGILDTPHINFAHKKWRAADFLHYWTQQPGPQQQHYRDFDAFMALHGVNYSTVLHLLCTLRGEQAIEAFQQGRFRMPGPEREAAAACVARAVVILQGMGYKWASTRPMVAALQAACHVVTPERLREKMLAYGKPLMRYSTAQEQAREIERIINYRSKHRVAIPLD